MKRSVVLVSISYLALAGAVVQAEEASPPSAAVAPPVVAPKPPAPPAAPVPKPAPVAKEKPAAAPPVSTPAEIPGPTHSGDIPIPPETKPVAEPGAAPGGLAGYAWLVFSFAMLIVGFVAGYFWRHHVSRHKLGGMTVRIGTWRGTP